MNNEYLTSNNLVITAILINVIKILTSDVHNKVLWIYFQLYFLITLITTYEEPFILYSNFSLKQIHNNAH